jgi:hypothetical protein
MAKARQRQPSSSQQQQLQGGTAAVAAAEGDVDAQKAARTKTLVLRTAVLVAATVVAAYFELIPNNLALAIIAAMCLCLRFFAV